MLKPPEPFFEVKPLSSWGSSWSVPDLPTQDWQEDKELKKLFGIELAKGLKPFEAALNIFEKNANKALWAANYWINDPVVIASRDLYKESVETTNSLLDKDALAVKLLEFADERAPQGFYVNDAKDRLAALKLYAEVRGFIGKIDINNSTNNVINNKLELVLIPPPNKDEKIKPVIDNEPVQEIKNNSIPLNLKLVRAVNS